MLGALFHAPLLRLTALPLIIEDAVVSADFVWVTDTNCDGCFDLAVDLVHRGQAGRVLVVEGDAKRLTALGIVPKWGEVARRELADRGVTADKLIVLTETGKNLWQQADAVNEWGDAQQPFNLIVICDRFGSRNLRFVLSSRLASSKFGATVLLALPDRRYDEHNWWRSRTGVEAVFFGSCGNLVDGGYV